MYLAHDPALDALVAVKLLADHHSAVPDLRERFVREARVLRRFDSPSVVTVHDIGTIDGQPYFVMEALQAGTLAERRMLLENAPCAASVRRVVAELAASLSIVHAAGLVHRDVKPSNLMIRRRSWTNDADHPVDLLADDETLVLGDFGLARDAALSNLTVGGGTEGYLAPEQRLPTSRIDHRADVFAASATLASLVIGRPLIRGDGVDPRADLASVAATPGFGIELQHALSVGMSPDPDDRYADIDAWRDAVTAALPSEPVPVGALSSVALVGGAPGAGRTRQRRRRWSVVAAAAVLVAVLLVAGLVGLIRSQDGSDDGPDIVGPTEIMVGESAVFDHARTPGAVYVWTTADGTTITDASVRISPSSAGTLTLTLTETVNGTESTTTRRIRVFGP